MCLDIKRGQKAIVAKEDIIVYKQVMRKDKHPRTYKSFYREASVVLGKTYTSDLIRDYFHNKISVGLHSLEYKEQAIRDIEYTPSFPDQGILVKYIIPKGSKYYKGTFSNMIAYASDTIIYTKEIVHEEKMN
jgi:hypothetical protein